MKAALLALLFAIPAVAFAADMPAPTSESDSSQASSNKVHPDDPDTRPGSDGYCRWPGRLAKARVNRNLCVRGGRDSEGNLYVPYMCTYDGFKVQNNGNFVRRGSDWCHDNHMD